MAFNAGSFARGLDNRTDAEVVIEALAALRAIYGAAVPEQPAEFVRTRWADDPWALGSYSYYAGAHRVHGVWVLRRRCIVSGPAAQEGAGRQRADPPYTAWADRRPLPIPHPAACSGKQP